MVEISNNKSITNNPSKLIIKEVDNNNKMITFLRRVRKYAPSFSHHRAARRAIIATCIIPRTLRSINNKLPKEVQDTALGGRIGVVEGYHKLRADTKEEVAGKHMGEGKEVVININSNSSLMDLLIMDRAASLASNRTLLEGLALNNSTHHMLQKLHAGLELPVTGELLARSSILISYRTTKTMT